MAIRHAITHAGAAATVPIHVPVKESKSNGLMQRAIRTRQGMLRTTKCHVERVAAARVPLLHPLVEWMILWAATLLYRFKNNRYGRTPYQMVTGHQSNRPIAPFGEVVHFRLADRRPHVHKGESVLVLGAAIGIADRSDQAFILTGDGIKACRSVRRVAPDMRWNGQSLLTLEWTVPEALYGEQDPSEEYPSNRQFGTVQRQVESVPPVM